MLTQVTLKKLHDMRLSCMADAFNDQCNSHDYDALSFEDRFGMLVDREWDKRRNSKLTKLIRSAGFRYPVACIEDIEYHPDRKLDRSEMLRLSTCRYITENHHIILKGASGSGKSYISNALGIAACRNFITVRYVRIPDLLGELAVARGDGTFLKVIKSYKKVNLLILDEFLLTPMTNEQANDILEIIEPRTDHGSIIFCTQFEPEGWQSRIGTEEYETLSDAIVDRILPNSYEIMIAGELSMRERRGIRSKGGEQRG
jgi:DNA replication protein DnaC